MFKYCDIVNDINIGWLSAKVENFMAPNFTPQKQMKISKKGELFHLKFDEKQYHKDVS